MLDVGVNNRMSEINALLSFSVLQNIDEIIENKHKIAGKYISACEKYGWEFIHPTATDRDQSLQIYTSVRAANPEKTFLDKDKDVFSVDYALGLDPNEVSKRHICLPIWYKLEDTSVQKVLNELQC